MRDTDKAAEGQMDGWLMFTSVTLSGEWQKSEWVCVNELLTEWVWYKSLSNILEENSLN